MQISNLIKLASALSHIESLVDKTGRGSWQHIEELNADSECNKSKRHKMDVLTKMRKRKPFFINDTFTALNE